eukprot:11562685-Alexandrium_andersonii.AAC.1
MRAGSEGMPAAQCRACERPGLQVRPLPGAPAVAATPPSFPGSTPAILAAGPSQSESEQLLPARLPKGEPSHPELAQQGPGSPASGPAPEPSFQSADGPRTHTSPRRQPPATGRPGLRS